MKRSILTSYLLPLIFFCACQAKRGSSELKYFDISDFGADPTGSQMSTKPIQDALNEAFRNGGGTVYFPPGKYLSGSIVLKDKVSLFFEGGAELIGSKELQDYSGEEKAFIRGNGLRHLKIYGKGTIDGNGRTFWDENFEELDRPEPWILLQNCRFVSIEGIYFQNSPSHTIRLEDSRNIRFTGISIVNPFQGPNTDGIDIVDSRNITISDSYISTGDDAICLKTHDDTVQNVVVTNTILESDDAAIKFGTGSQTATRFCTFSNIMIRRTRYGIAFFMLDGGIYEHNNFSNIVMEGGSRHKREYPIYIDIDKRLADRTYGQIRDNTFSNIKMVGGGKILVSGHPESRIENLKFENITFDVVNARSFDGAKKPRGNKRYPKLETSIDLSEKPGHLVFGYTNGLFLEDIKIYEDQAGELKRQKVYTEEVNNLNMSDIY